MGSYLSSATSARRQPRRGAAAAIGLVAVIGLVTACTASSVGAAKRAPDRYPAGASVQAQAQTKSVAETPQTLRLEQQARRAANGKVSGATTLSEYQLTRSEHQHGK